MYDDWNYADPECMISSLCYFADAAMTPSFPLSFALRMRRCQLGRNARMLACQSLDRVFAPNKVK